MNKSVLTLLLIICFTGAFSAAKASASWLPVGYAKASAKQGKAITAQQAASIVKRKYGGKVLKVSASGKGYRVKVIKADGRIVSVYVDGKTGKVRG